MMSKAKRIETSLGPARITRTPRRTLAISVLPDASIELTAPENATEEAILKKVEKRTAWIQRQQRAFTVMNAARQKHRYCNGATHRYLGRQYRLAIIRGDSPSVSLRGAYLYVIVPHKSDEAVKRVLELWYREKAREQFSKRLLPWKSWCQNRRLPAPKLQLKSMKKRWGSAQKNGAISLNPELVHAPAVCVDYVITHEICHLKHPDHGPSFYRLLKSLLPNWIEIKLRLESIPL